MSLTLPEVARCSARLLCQAECASGIMPSVTAAPLHMTAVTSAGTTVTRKRPGSADSEAGAACHCQWHCQWQWNGRDLRAGMRRALRLTARPPQLQPANLARCHGRLLLPPCHWQHLREHSGSKAQVGLRANLRPVRSPLAT